MTQTILIAGSTGMFGGRIAHHLQDRDAHLRLLVRAGSDTKGLDPLIAAGAEIIEGDLTDPASLDRATEGVDVIVSAVNGGPEIVVDGQVALAEAGHRNGARRILPSDYALDLFKATPGEHPFFDQRAEADARIAEIGIGHVHILQGSFMMMVANGFTMFPDADGAGLPTVNHETRMARFYGTGDETVEVTSMDDTARMIARVALDRDVPDGKFAFCGDKVSFNEAVDLIEKTTGATYERHSLGDETTLRATMARSEGMARNMIPYALYMLNGQTALDDLQTDRYPDLKLESFVDYVARTMG